MKRFLTILTIALMCCIFINIPQSTMAAGDPYLDAGFIQARIKAPALDFTLEDLEGKQVRFTDFRGKVVLMFFWTTW